MARNNLLNQLIALPRTPPPTALRALTVAPMAALPANLRFGPMSPPALGGSRFSGGLVPNPINPLRNLPADFRGPGYGSPSQLTGAIGGLSYSPLQAANAITSQIRPRPPGPPAPPGPPLPQGPTIVGPPDRQPAPPGAVPGFVPHQVGYPDATRLQPTPGVGQLAPRVTGPSRIAGGQAPNPRTFGTSADLLAALALLGSNLGTARSRGVGF